MARRRRSNLVVCLLCNKPRQPGPNKYHNIKCQGCGGRFCHFKRLYCSDPCSEKIRRRKIQVGVSDHLIRKNGICDLCGKAKVVPKMHRRRCPGCKKRFCSEYRQECCSRVCYHKAKSNQNACGLCGKTVRTGQQKYEVHDKGCQKCGTRFCSDRSDYCSTHCGGKGCITKPESVIKKLAGPAIKYTGSGKQRLRIDLTRTPWRRSKNPDFIVRSNPKKVIEVFGGEGYFHHRKEAKKLVASYKAVGIRCLLLWEKDIYNDRSSVSNRLQRFIA